MLALAFACVLLGCGKSDPEVAVASTDDWAKDKAFVQELTAQKAERTKMLAKRQRISEQLNAVRAQDPGSKQVGELERQLAECDAAFEKSRQASLATMRARISKKGGDKK